MPLKRLLLVLLVCAAAGGAFAGHASAFTIPLPACPTTAGTNSVATPHFIVWYDSDPSANDYTTETEAGDIGAYAELAYSAYASAGFPAPATSFGGKTDIYITDLSSPWAVDSDVCPATPGTFMINFGLSDASDKTMTIVGAGVFDEIEYTLFPSLDPNADQWLSQGAAQWASAMALGYPVASASDVGPPDMSLDCWDPNYTITLTRCAPDWAFEGQGYSRWPFYEYLAETYGNTFIDQVLTAAQAAGPDNALTGLSNALAAKGTSLAAAWNAFTLMDVTGAYTAAPLSHRVPASSAKVSTGLTSGTVVKSLRVSVDHLATRYLEFDRGDGVGATACFAATLSLSVTIPAGTSSQPVFFWTGPGGTSTPLTVSGGTATASVPWDTCTWSTSEGLLALPNASSTLNSANFYVTATLTLSDPPVPASAGAPTAPISIWGQVVPVTSTTLPPAITLANNQLLTLSSTDRQLYLVIESGSEGSVQASIGSVSLGTTSVTPGENQVVFKLPVAVLESLRRSAGTSSLLTVTPVTANGAVAGQPVTRNVMVAPAAKPTVKKTVKKTAKKTAKTKKTHHK